ncbi:MAG: carbohydrate ABC transporter substrate-binding protein [Ruminococcus sp.]|nr:carbohydrate ABC transporter substrate-binding protein [Ruminococcus sp.]
MNTLKRTLALVATLAMSATAFVSCGSDDSSSSKKASTTAASTEAGSGASEASTANASAASTKAAETPSKGNSTTLGEVKLGKGGSEFSIAAWNEDDVPFLIDLWAQNGGDKSKVKFTSFGVGGGKASENYDALFQSGKDLDVYFCEADWALKYINDDTKTAALEELGFSEDNFSDVYSYTTEIGRATEGANKGKMVGASWQAAAGGFAYRTDLAEQYLGVKTPEEMQKKINNWDNFVAAATEVATKTDGKVALADSLGGMWQVFAANRKTPWVANGRVAFDQECETFAKYAKTLWDNGGVTKNGQWTDSWIPAGKDGSAMGYFVSTWGFGEKAFFGQVSSESYGKWAVVQGPSAYFWGGTWIVVNPKTDNAEEAQQFIYTATVNPETMRKLALDKPEYVNNRTVMQTIVDNNECPNEWVTKDLNGQNYFAELHENAKSIDLKGLITPYDATIKTNFINAVQKEYCEGGASYEDTISKALSDVLTAIPDLAK